VARVCYRLDAISCHPTSSVKALHLKTFGLTGKNDPLTLSGLGPLPDCWWLACRVCVCAWLTTVSWPSRKHARRQAQTSLQAQTYEPKSLRTWSTCTSTSCFSARFNTMTRFYHFVLPYPTRCSCCIGRWCYSCCNDEGIGQTLIHTGPSLLFLM